MQMAKVDPEEKDPSPVYFFRARAPGTHAEHAATSAKVLWACDSGEMARNPARVARTSHFPPANRRGRKHNPISTPGNRVVRASGR